MFHTARIAGVGELQSWCAANAAPIGKRVLREHEFSSVLVQHTHTPTGITALFPGLPRYPSGEPVPERSNQSGLH